MVSYWIGCCDFLNRLFSTFLYVEELNAHAHTHVNSIEKIGRVVLFDVLHMCHTRTLLCMFSDKKPNEIASICFCYILIFEIWTIFSSRFCAVWHIQHYFLAPFSFTLHFHVVLFLSLSKIWNGISKYAWRSVTRRKRIYGRQNWVGWLWNVQVANV